jgi:prolyl 4-hydroxylase
MMKMYFLLGILLLIIIMAILFPALSAITRSTTKKKKTTNVNDFTEKDINRVKVDPPDFQNKTLLHNAVPYPYLLHNFLNDAECKHVITLCNDRFKRSTTTTSDGKDVPHSVRTSHSCQFSESETPILRKIEERAAIACRVPVSHIEGLQVVRYHPGQKYDAHNDWFHHEKIDNQRYKTILIYLNDDFEGGSTDFVHSSVDKKVNPKKGDALYWHNSWLTPESNYKDYLCFEEAKHQGSPPTSGVKYAVNVWVRLKPYRSSNL